MAAEVAAEKMEEKEAKEEEMEEKEGVFHFMPTKTLKSLKNLCRVSLLLNKK